MAGLGQGLMQTGRLSPTGFDSALKALGHIIASLLFEDFGFILGLGDDGCSLVNGFLLPALEAGEQLLGLFAQAPRFGDLIGNALGARVQLLGDQAGNADIDHHTDDDEERQGDPEGGLVWMDPVEIHDVRPLATVADGGLDRFVVELGPRQ